MRCPALGLPVVLLVGGLWLGVGEARAEEAPAVGANMPGIGAGPVDDWQPNVKPRLEVTRSTGAIDIDGEVSDAGWQGVARARNFAEFRPSNKTRPAMDTEVLVTYDENNLYLAFLCEDDPATIRGGLRDRDDIWRDDYVGILFDTFGDNSAYEVFLNPLGVQGDLRLLSSGNEDMGLDLVMKSKGKITPSGYQVELAIPFSSLRFPEAPVQTWRTTFWRNRPRGDRQNYSWAAIDQGEPCFSCAWGEMTGITNVRRGTSLALLPALVSSQGSHRADPGDPTSRFINDDARAELSLNARYALGSDLAASAAINPDFSQIESDASQIDVNSTFALFYDERRPFFSEASDLYSTPITAVYTRQINDPSAAGRITGRIGKANVAYIGARDEHSPVLVPLEEGSLLAGTGLKSTTNIARGKVALGQENSLGGLVTDRRFDGGGANTVGGLDGKLRFLKNYRLEGQALISHTRERNDATLSAELGADGLTFSDGRHTAAMDGESFNGTALSGFVYRDGEHINFNTGFEQYAPTFRADEGFVTGNDLRKYSGWGGWTARPNGRLVKQIQTNVNWARIWNWDGVGKDRWVNPELYLGLAQQTSFDLNWLTSHERFHGHEFPGIWRVYASLSSDFSKRVQFGSSMNFGRYIARNLSTPVLGRGYQYTLRVTLKPVERMVIEPRLQYATLDQPRADATGHRQNIFSGYILRTRLQYQFTRELFLRAIVQYDDFGQYLQIDPLLSYKLNPYTVAFLGSSHGYQDFAPSEAPPGRDGLNETARQFFLKFQYLFQI